MLLSCAFCRKSTAPFLRKAVYGNAEDQDSYVTTIFREALAFSIPITCQTPEDTAVIFDALAYEGQKPVVPEYLGNTVEQKGLRNEESIEAAIESLESK